MDDKYYQDSLTKVDAYMNIMEKKDLLPEDVRLAYHHGVRGMICSYAARIRLLEYESDSIMEMEVLLVRLDTALFEAGIKQVEALPADFARLQDWIDTIKEYRDEVSKAIKKARKSKKPIRR